jgi:hypothetical protein
MSYLNTIINVYYINLIKDFDMQDMLQCRLSTNISTKVHIHNPGVDF